MYTRLDVRMRRENMRLIRRVKVEMDTENWEQTLVNLARIYLEIVENWRERDLEKIIRRIRECAPVTDVVVIR